jgi:hypothetical protein
MMKVVRMMVIIPHVMVEEPHKMAKALHILTEAPLEKTSHNLRQFWLSINILHVMISHYKEDQQLETFWSLESLGITRPTTNNNGSSLSREYQQSAISCEDDSSYTAKFMWKDNHPALPSNFSICQKPTRSTVQRLSRSPELLQTYGTIINDQLEKGFIEKIPDSIPTSNSHYIPHHPVRKISSTTPIRIVYDCSCHQSQNQTSLNDCLQAGPPLLNDMTAILLRFRTYNYSIATDIENAFHHLHLHECNRDFTRFLWLSDPDDPDSPFDTYRFKAVPFGTTSSPFMLNATLQKHVERFSTPVARNMKENMYVDNILSGDYTELNASQYYDESRSIMTEVQPTLMGLK